MQYVDLESLSAGPADSSAAVVHFIPYLGSAERVLILFLKGAGQWKPPRAVPPVSAPRVPQLRPL
eukprot:2892951-Pyramimonas_sp.AAC.1